MPKPDGTMYPWERAELNNAQARYEKAVRATKMHLHSARIYKAAEKKAFADLMAITAKYASCR